MKKTWLIVFTLCLFIIDVKADESKEVIPHQVMVTNKEGTACYKDGKKTKEVIPYKTMLTVNTDISGSYINVVNDEYDCLVTYSDVSANKQSFDLDTKGVSKINNIRAIVLPSTGLNMRVGPSVTYAKVMTIPKNTILTLTHKAGTYWYYTEYNGKSGWVTSMNKYIGFDDNKVLINYEKIKLYNTNGKTVLTNIAENTEITDYLKLDTGGDDFKYFVSYNGTKGYIKDMLYKTSDGKIKLIKDVEIKDDKGNAIRKMTAGSEIQYNMVNENNEYYISEKNVLVNLKDEDYEYIKEGKILIKEKGYIGEGIFGEEIKEKEEIASEETEIKEDTGNSEMSAKDIIIICLLSGIFIALVVIVIIKIVNSKKQDNKIEKI